MRKVRVGEKAHMRREPFHPAAVPSHAPRHRCSQDPALLTWQECAAAALAVRHAPRTSPLLLLLSSSYPFLLVSSPSRLRAHLSVHALPLLTPFCSQVRHAPLVSGQAVSDAEGGAFLLALRWAEQLVPSLAAVTHATHASIRKVLR